MDAMARQKDTFDIGFLDLLPGVHHYHTLGHFRYHTQIVGN